MYLPIHIKRFIVVCVLLALSTFCRSQSPLSATFQSDTTNARFVIIRPSTMPLNIDSYVSRFYEAYKYYKHADYVDGAFTSLISRSIKYYEKEDYDGEIATCKEALPWAERSTQKDAVAWCYDNIGDAYFSQGDYERASEFFYRALDELQKRKAPVTHVTVNVYNALGLVYMRLEQYDKAIAFFRQALDMSRPDPLYYQFGNSLGYIGDYFIVIHEPDSAEKYFTVEMEIGRKKLKKDLETSALASLGKTHIEEGKYELAIGDLQTAISLSRGVYDDIANSASFSLGDAFLHSRKYRDAENVLISALNEARQHNFKDNYIYGYTSLEKVYEATGQYQEALTCLDSVTNLKNALMSGQKTIAINQLEIKYKNAETEKQLAENELKISRRESSILKREAWIFSIAGGIFILAIILYALYRNSLHKQHMQAEQIKSLKQENKIDVLKAVMAGEDKERSRIARELHDGLGGIVSAAMMRLMAIRHDNESVTKIQAYQDTMQLLEQTADEIRQTAHNLMPEVLMKQTLPDAVRAFCNNMQDKSGLKIDFQYHGEFNNITPDLKLGTYRILQELLKNIIKHAEATQVLVELQIFDQTMAITVEDNGIGFDTNEQNNGIGLQNVKTRVNSHNGQYTLQTDPGKGTSVYIEFDLHQLVADT